MARGDGKDGGRSYSIKILSSLSFSLAFLNMDNIAAVMASTTIWVPLEEADAFEVTTERLRQTSLLFSIRVRVWCLQTKLPCLLSEAGDITRWISGHRITAFSCHLQFIFYTHYPVRSNFVKIYILEYE